MLSEQIDLSIDPSDVLLNYSVSLPLAVPLNIYFYMVVMSLYNRLGPYGDLCVKARDVCEYPHPLQHHPNNLPKGMIYSAYPRY